MSSITLSTAANTVLRDKYQPVDFDGEPITWADNPAYLPGVLFNVGEFYKQKGFFQALLKNRAVKLKNGLLAVDSTDTVYFIMGTVKDPVERGVMSPCPPTATRRDEFDDDAALNSTDDFKKLASTVGADAIAKRAIYAPEYVEDEDAALLSSLSYIFELSYVAADLISSANGSGLKLLELLHEKAEEAEPTDRALVMTEYTAVATKGVTSELNIVSFDLFVKLHNKAERHLGEKVRPPREAVCEMYKNIIIADPTHSIVFETRLANPKTDPGNNVTATIKLCRSVLRRSKVQAELAAAKSGTPQLGLVAQPAKPAPPAQPTATDSALTTALNAISAKLALITDPVKNGGRQPGSRRDRRDKGASRGGGGGNGGGGGGNGGGGNGGGNGTNVEAPRDADGKVTKWIPGMPECGIDGCAGHHLRRDHDTLGHVAPPAGRKKALVVDQLSPEEIGVDRLALRHQARRWRLRQGQGQP
jgi:uncharacterized membrane protein YgcG